MQILADSTWQWLIGNLLPRTCMGVLARTQYALFVHCATIAKLQATLVRACRYGEFDTVQQLAHHPCVDLGFQHQLPLYTAATHGQVHVVDFLLQQFGVDPNYRPDNHQCKRPSIFVAAVSHYETAVVRRLLLDPRVNPAEMDNFAISVAAGNSTIVALLLADARVWQAQTVLAESRAWQAQAVSEIHSEGVYL